MNDVILLGVVKVLAVFACPAVPAVSVSLPSWTSSRSWTASPSADVRVVVLVFVFTVILGVVFEKKVRARPGGLGQPHSVEGLVQAPLLGSRTPSA